MSTEVARVGDAHPVQLDNIATLDDAMEVCQVLAQSDIVPRSLQGKPANLLLVYLNGRELKLSFAQSLRTIFSPGPGQIGMRVQLMLAKLHEAGHNYTWEFGGEEREYGCTFSLTRSGATKPLVSRFTLNDALAARLVKENANGELVAFSNDRALPWMLYVDDMLFARAATRGVSRGAPEVLLGFEVIDNAVQQEDVQLQPAPVAAPSDVITPERYPERPAADTVAAELTALNNKATEPEAATPPAGPAATTTGGEATAPAPAGRQWANSRQLGQLSRMFRDLGWNPQSHMAQCLEFMTAFTRRVITKPTDLYSTDATELANELTRIKRTAPEDAQPVVLEESMASWMVAWEADDPTGFAAVMDAGDAADRD